MWFGKSWGAPICDPEDHGPTPVGHTCGECLELITEGDQGVSMPFVRLDERPATIVYHVNCWLRHILPHGPDCKHCRGLERNQHKLSCSYAKHGGDCDCPHGKDMQRLLDPRTTLAEVHNIAERVGTTAAALLDALKLGRAAHNPGDDASKPEVPQTHVGRTR